VAGEPAPQPLRPPSPPAAGPAPEAGLLEASAQRVSNLATIARLPSSQTPPAASQRRQYTPGTETGATSKGSPYRVPSTWGKSSTAAKAIKSPQAGSPKPSTSALAYNTVASNPKNFLIHVYETRDDPRPFRFEEEFCHVQDTIKTAIWAFFEKHGPDTDLVVKAWSFRRTGSRDYPGEGVGIIYCTSEARQHRAMDFIVSIHLGDSIIKTVSDPSEGMKMSFKKPQFGPQSITQILEAIFFCNRIEGPERCGSREERTNTPREGNPFKVCTVHFPLDLVKYAVQRSYHIDGPDGQISFYGKEVAKRRRTTFKSAEAVKKVAEAAAALAAPNVSPPEEPFTPSVVATALAAAYEAGLTATIPSVLSKAPEAGQEATLMAPYPTAIIRALDTAAHLGTQKEPHRAGEDEFEAMSKSKSQRWIRTLKGF
jgi:hypothetical protein